MARPTFATVDDYIASFPPHMQDILRQVRATIQKTIPEATEKISYGIPTFMLNGTYVVYFAGYAKHSSMYPIHFVDEALLKEVEPYRSGKSTLRFDASKPIPHALIKKVARALAAANQQRTSSSERSV
jgi:uncharacterized protein YdhG (YjbR/CyaY superfamily)